MTEKMHKTGILFCGGCNPYFERIEVYREIVKHFKDRMSFLLYSRESSYDYVLLINGCQSECLMDEAYKGKLIVINNNNFETAVQVIEEIINKDPNS